MKIDRNYTLKGDKYNWILSYKSDTKTNDKGKEYFSTDIWYFSNIKDAINKYVSESLKPNETSKDLISMINELSKRLVDVAEKKLT